mmetsp:Transcript_9005/g.20280  ORF Transcript_9005/g.20280 Transcript_9005/m.20280 type:complete len:268 (-) Transcript_9005:639-1442(-)
MARRTRCGARPCSLLQLISSSRVPLPPLPAPRRLPSLLGRPSSLLDNPRFSSAKSSKPSPGAWKACHRHSTSSTIQRNFMKTENLTQRLGATGRQVRWSSGQTQYTQRVPQGPSFFRFIVYDMAVSRRERRRRTVSMRSPSSALRAERRWEKSVWWPMSTKQRFPSRRLASTTEGRKKRRTQARAAGREGCCRAKSRTPCAEVSKPKWHWDASKPRFSYSRASLRVVVPQWPVDRAKTKRIFFASARSVAACEALYLPNHSARAGAS